MRDAYAYYFKNFVFNFFENFSLIAFDFELSVNEEKDTNKIQQSCLFTCVKYKERKEKKKTSNNKYDINNNNNKWSIDTPVWVRPVKRLHLLNYHIAYDYLASYTASR